ncbi:cytochrome P450, putative [Talaromyces stipitatus ATCC 10500]|uniref:Cytochrome P450, putative n=1 Tax=Talaromyces stipitatus (strain ATCC 10500 / CBS 375.48 / QM 6759 / NRRL 1006) TaxID=441959 RepID=B8MJT2_TALSN|nr:cytochrome P450, putative [Talaromyces stipitatus ATCC 10500]EED14749.1 cytochrome P450, putative [Talaromyces stipitatus ATCC 10500]
MSAMPNLSNMWPRLNLFFFQSLQLPFALPAILAYVLLRYIYRKYFYPKFFTPLKPIPLATPTPPKNGKEEATSTRKGVAALRHAAATIPNNGLLRFYRENDHSEQVLVTGIKALNEILVLNASSFGKPESVRRRLYSFAGNGLLLAEGETHKVQRKGLMPAFSFRHIKDLYPIFWSKSRDLVKVLEKEISGDASSKSDVIVMRTWATRTTLDILGLAGMDHDFRFLDDPNNLLIQQYEKTQIPYSRTEILIGFVLSLFTSNYEAILPLIPIGRVRLLQEGAKYIRQVCRELIQEKWNKMSNAESQSGVDIISAALKSDVFTTENLVDHMMTFLAAGHATTSHALQWSVYALCKHQDMQQRLREEVRNHLPSISDPESTVTANDVDSLSYLHAFCNEVLRFYPSIPATVREAMCDTTIAGYRIPKGTGFLIPIGLVNHDPELWGPTASTFDPDRWLGEGRGNSGGVKNHLGFLTFLHGPRSCIGSGFAKAELACLVAAIVGRFQMELEDPTRKFELSSVGIGTSPKDGVRTRLKILNGW